MQCNSDRKLILSMFSISWSPEKKGIGECHWETQKTDKPVLACAAVIPFQIAREQRKAFLPSLSPRFYFVLPSASQPWNLHPAPPSHPPIMYLGNCLTCKEENKFATAKKDSLIGSPCFPVFLVSKVSKLRRWNSLGFPFHFPCVFLCISLHRPRGLGAWGARGPAPLPQF